MPLCTGSTGRATRNESSRPQAPTSICSGSGAAAFTRVTIFTTSATSRACSPGRTSCSPVRRTPKRSRCARRSKPRCATTSCGCFHTRASSSGTAATRTSGATRNGAGRTGSGTGAGGLAITSTFFLACSPNSIRPVHTRRAARSPRPTSTIRTTQRMVRCTSGISGTAVIIRTIAPTRLALSVNSAGRDRRPGPP